MTPIVLLTYHFVPDNVPSVLRPAWFYRYLPDYGFDPHVVACSTTYWFSRPGREPREPGVERVPISPWAKRLMQRTNWVVLVWGRFVMDMGDYGAAWIPLAFFRGWQAMRRTGARLLYSTSPPIAPHVAAWLLKKLTGATWIMDLQDPLANEPHTVTGPWTRRYKAMVEYRLFAAADHVIANTDTVAEMWRQTYPQWAGKFTTVWNGFDPAEAVAARELPPRPYRVLAHVGSIYGGRDPGALVAALQRLLAGGRIDQASTRLLLVGPFDMGTVRDRGPFDALREAGVLDMRTEYIPRAEANRIAAESDYLVVLDVNPKNASLQVPSKLYDYVRIGRPVLAITARESPVERILRGSGITYRCLYPDAPVEENAGRLAELLAEPTTPATPSAWFTDTFNARVLTGQVAALARARRE